MRVLNYDVCVIGAGAAGLMAATTAAKRSKKVILIEHTSKIGEKIRISGGGRCNFTNLFASPSNYLSKNPHFCKSALAGYTQQDFIKLVESSGISYHEKTLGQLFCDGSSKQIIEIFLKKCQKHGVEIKTACTVTDIEKDGNFLIQTSQGKISSSALIIATGGLSIPQLGASDFGYRVAKKFGHTLIGTRPGLVPLTLPFPEKERFSHLSGVSVYTKAFYKKQAFVENSLFTHRGLSGPAILQISSYMEQFKNQTLTLDLLPTLSLEKEFMIHKNSKQTVSTFLKTHLSSRLVDVLGDAFEDVFQKKLVDCKKETLNHLAKSIHGFVIQIDSSEGYQKAEVTVGGVNTKELSSKTMQSNLVPGLFFVGEVVDVTGWLGGYNFQWAWSSGFAAGSYC